MKVSKIFANSNAQTKKHKTFSLKKLIIILWLNIIAIVSSLCKLLKLCYYVLILNGNYDCDFRQGKPDLEGRLHQYFRPKTIYSQSHNFKFKWIYRF